MICREIFLLHNYFAYKCLQYPLNFSPVLADIRPELPGHSSRTQANTRVQATILLKNAAKDNTFIDTRRLLPTLRDI